MASPITVLAVDDRAVFLRAARELIAATPGFEQVGEAASGAEALALAADLRPDLALVDVRMPGMDGIETARRLHASDPDMVVVLISLDEVPDGAVRRRRGVRAQAGAVDAHAAAALGPHGHARASG